MSQRSEIDVRDIARVVTSGATSYLLVHFVLLPQLIKMGVSFPAYFYIGVVATAVFSVAISYLVRPRATVQDGARDGAQQMSSMYPAE